MSSVNMLRCLAERHKRINACNSKLPMTEMSEECSGGSCFEEKYDQYEYHVDRQLSLRLDSW